MACRTASSISSSSSTALAISSDGGGCAGFRHTDHQVSVNRTFAGQSTADVESGAVYRSARNRAVRTRKVDVFEDAALGFGVGEPARPDAVGIDRQQFAGFDLADE